MSKTACWKHAGITRPLPQDVWHRPVPICRLYHVFPSPCSHLLATVTTSCTICTGVSVIFRKGVQAASAWSASLILVPSRAYLGSISTPSHPYLLLLPVNPSLLLPSTSFPSPSLRSRLPLIQLRVWRSAVSSPAGPGGSRPPNAIWCILGWKCLC